MGDMKTTVLIDQGLGHRLKICAEKFGVNSMSAMAELSIRKALDFIESNGYDSFIAISSKRENNVQKTNYT